MSRFHTLLTVCLAALCVTSVAGQRGSAPDAQVILEREQQRVKYLLAGDIDGLGKMTSPSLSYSHSSGAIDGREKYLTDLRTRRVVYRSVNNRDVAVRLVTPQVAVLNGLSDVEVKVADQELKMTLRFTIVYVQKDGEWLFEAWHSARLQP